MIQTMAQNTPCRHPRDGLKGRRLVVCIDGTSNRFGLENTNVVELYKRLPKTKTQITYYNSGIGTFTNPSRNVVTFCLDTIASAVSMAFALDVDRTIMDAYQWLSEAYEENDEIYLIGYSRGAYQVRALAGMLKLVGLVKKGNKAQIGFAYDLYSNSQDGSEIKRTKFQEIVGAALFMVLLWVIILSPLGALCAFAEDINRYFDGQIELVFWVEVIATIVGLVLLMLDRGKPVAHRPEDLKRLAVAFKKTFSYSSVHIHFVGCWDTVSAIGAIGGKTLPFTHNGDHICFFRHALALDEHRGRFFAEYANPHGVPGLETSDASARPSEKLQVAPQLKEVWFPGQHGDVGGRTSITPSLKPFCDGNPSLRWIAIEARACGLNVNEISTLGWCDKELRITPQMGQFWRNMENAPIRRFAYNDQGQRITTYSPNIFKGRTILPGQRLHFSIAFCKLPYHPKATTGGQKKRCGQSLRRPQTQLDNKELFLWPQERTFMPSSTGGKVEEFYKGCNQEEGCPHCDMRSLEIEYDDDLCPAL